MLGARETGTQTPLLIALFGPTASGKSALALYLAAEFGAAIVTADSRQVYRLMDIGTDKPSPQERAVVPHHMLDLVFPDEPFTLADYQDGAYRAIRDVHSRGTLPILAGGTPLYLNAVLEGWQIPRVEPNPEFRRLLEAEAAASGSEALHARLAQADPAAATTILPTNTRRLIRALEVIEATGLPFSGQKGRSAPAFNVLKIGLIPDREDLYGRIDVRVDLQVERGLVVEVADLLSRGYGVDLPSMSGIGYRQIAAYLQGRSTLPEAIQRIKWDTHSFTRHQLNWFRRVTDAAWLNPSSPDMRAEAARLVANLVAQGA